MAKRISKAWLSLELDFVENKIRLRSFSYSDPEDDDPQSEVNAYKRQDGELSDWAKHATEWGSGSTVRGWTVEQLFLALKNEAETAEGIS